MSKTNTLAIVSLVAGLVSWTMMPVVASIVAVITGHMARKQIRDSHGVEEGSGLALVGLVLGYANLLAGLVGIVLAVLVLAGVIGLGIFGAMFS